MRHARRARGARRFLPTALAAAGLCALALAGCGGGGDLGAEAAGPRQTAMFVVSTRRGETPPASEASNDGVGRFSLQFVSTPPGHRVGQLEAPSIGAPDPARHFALVKRRPLDEDGFLTTLATHLSGRVGSNRDVLLYVHGFNTSYDEARFRLAQIVEDGRFGGVPALFTWPSTNALLDYGAAKENATISRDALARVIRELTQTPDVGRVHILAHSMGSWLTMEALRQNAIAYGPAAGEKLGDVMLAAPDIDLNVFRQQISRLDPSHVFVLVAANDRALSLSRTLAGDRPRLGALDPTAPVDRAALEALGVRVYDLTREADIFIGHGAYSAPDAVRSIGAQIAAPRAQDANVQSVLGERPVDDRILSTPLSPLAPAAAAAPALGSAPSSAPAPVVAAAAPAPAAPAP
ncbi:alpha/beta hydrolase [Methylocella sp.]|uniref:alpha/beta hydrolase n=1 Tax=Methylocella sp. TaxID=1978226 RepID=UPI003784AF45